MAFYEFFCRRRRFQMAAFYFLSDVHLLQGIKEGGQIVARECTDGGGVMGCGERKKANGASVRASTLFFQRLIFFIVHHE